MVDNLLSDFTNSNDLSTTSEFCHLYKNSNRANKLSQHERRELLLKDQKNRRHDLVDGFRDVAKIFFDDENVEFSESTEVLVDMDFDNIEEQKKPQTFNFMESEWFSEVPEDLEENWLVKLVPEGFRVLAVAKRNKTIIFNKKGRVLTLKTHLPGGGLTKGSGLTVLDCIYNKVSKTIFILDCLHWNTMSLLDSETNFRFYWLKNKFDENSKFVQTNKSFKLYPLDFFPAQRAIIQDKVFEPLNTENKVLCEGLAFYHKELHYIFEETPLLGWLFTYMLPEKLGLDILPENLSKMPNNYECLEKYVENLKQKNNQKHWRKSKQEKNKMDIS